LLIEFILRGIDYRLFCTTFGPPGVVSGLIKQNLSAAPCRRCLCTVHRDFGSDRDFRNFTPITIVNGQMLHDKRMRVTRTFPRIFLGRS